MLLLGLAWAADTLLLVTPLQVEATDPSLRPLGPGLTEMLREDLDAAEGVEVVDPLPPSMQERPQRGLPLHEDPWGMARELGAGAVLIGQLDAEEERLRIQAQVLDTTTGETLVEAVSEGPREEVFRLEAELVEELVAGLNAKLAERTAAELKARAQGSLEGAVAYGTAVEELQAGHRDAAREAAIAAMIDNPGFGLADQLALELKQRDTVFVGMDLSWRQKPDYFDQGRAPWGFDASVELGAFLGPVALFGQLGFGPTHSVELDRVGGFISGWEESYSLSELRLGSKLELDAAGRNHLNLVVAGSVVSGWHSQRADSNFLASHFVSSVGGVGGVELVRLRDKQHGLCVGMLYSVHPRPLGSEPGYLGSGQARIQGVELRLGYDLFVGRELERSVQRARGIQ